MSVVRKMIYDATMFVNVLIQIARTVKRRYQFLRELRNLEVAIGDISYLKSFYLGNCWKEWKILKNHISTWSTRQVAIILWLRLGDGFTFGSNLLVHSSWRHHTEKNWK